MSSGREVQSVDLEVGALSCIASRDCDAPYAQRIQEVKEAVKSIRSYAADVSKITQKVGTTQRGDLAELKVQVARWVHEAEAAGDSAQNWLKQSHLSGDGSLGVESQQRLQKQKLTENLSYAVTAFTDAVVKFNAATAAVESTSTDADRASEAPVTVSSGSRDCGCALLQSDSVGSLCMSQTPISETQSQGSTSASADGITLAVPISSLEINDMMIDERSRHISAISGQIRGLNAIFQEIMSQVHVQGGDIDNIESNMLQAANNTAQGTAQVQITSESAKRRTKCLGCLVLVVLLTVATICLFIVMRNH